jgi:hypothetical protein
MGQLLQWAFKRPLHGPSLFSNVLFEAYQRFRELAHVRTDGVALAEGL